MNRATIQHHAKLKAEGYKVQPCGTDLRGWTLTHDDGCGNGPANLMIGAHGCIAPTQWEAVAEGLSRIDDDHRYDEAPAITTVPQLVDAFCSLAEHAASQPVLTGDVLDTIRMALMDQSGTFVTRMNRMNTTAGYWAGELWAIDRARRALEL